jgi:phage-related protein
VRELVWIGSSQADVRSFPDAIRRTIGYALYVAQFGGKHPSAKPLKGFTGAGTLEIADDHDGDTYRAVYTLTLPGVVYVLHAFQKKSRRGIATPQGEMELIRRRLQWAREIHDANKRS